MISRVRFGTARRRFASLMRRFSTNSAGVTAKHTFERPIKMARRHARSSRQRIDRKVFVQISHHPVDKFCKPISRLTVKHERVGQFMLAIAVHRRADKLLGNH